MKTRWFAVAALALTLTGCGCNRPFLNLFRGTTCTPVTCVPATEAPCMTHDSHMLGGEMIDGQVIEGGVIDGGMVHDGMIIGGGVETLPAGSPKIITPGRRTGSGQMETAPLDAGS